MVFTNAQIEWRMGNACCLSIVRRDTGNSSSNMIADGIVRSFALNANYPDPFDPTTAISYTLPEEIHVKLTVYGVLGQEIAGLADEVQPARDHQATFNAADLPGGVYIYKPEAGKISQINKMVLSK